MSILFPEPPAPFTGPLRHDDPDVAWLQRATRPEAVADRRRINTWYADFPDPQPHRMATKLHSTVNEAFHSALDELHIHHLLRQVEPDVRYEEHGQGEPDFRVYRAGHEVLVVEVLSLFIQKDWAAEQRNHDALADFLNERLRPEGYLLHVEIGVQEQNIRRKKLMLFASEFLDSLPDPAEIRAAYQAGDPLPATDFLDPGVHVRLEAWPRSPAAISSTTPDARIVGLGPIIGGQVTSHERLSTPAALAVRVGGSVRAWRGPGGVGATVTRQGPSSA